LLNNQKQKVLVIGGRGYFGRLLVDDLGRIPGCHVTVASRHASVFADLRDEASLKRALDGTNVAICAAGPYQDLPTTLAELCVQNGIHYIDLADDRRFVRNIRSIAKQNANCRSAVCTGWSTVSAVSGLLAKIASHQMTIVDSIGIQMAPGNRGARHTATIASLLHSVGQPLLLFRDGRWRSVTGWSDPRDFIFPMPIGVRRGYIVDVPDHDLFPELFGVRTVEFRAGSELQILNHCLTLLGKKRRDWARLGRHRCRGRRLRQTKSMHCGRVRWRKDRRNAGQYHDRAAAVWS
jgi:saccharopine dehydrogenase-like NADP-dependent oxidoreductase